MSRLPDMWMRLKSDGLYIWINWAGTKFDRGRGWELIKHESMEEVRRKYCK